MNGLIRQYRFEEGGTQIIFNAEGLDPIVIPGTAHGSTLCVPGSLLVMVNDGTGAGGAGLKLRPCLSPS